MLTRRVTPRRPPILVPASLLLFSTSLAAIRKGMVETMKTFTPSILCGSIVMLALGGCTTDEPAHKKEAPQQPAPAASAKKVEVGKNVYLEIQGEQRRVLVESYVCLRKGQLEQFLTRKRTKEHEAILAADVDARKIHE